MISKTATLAACLLLGLAASGAGASDHNRHDRGYRDGPRSQQHFRSNRPHRVQQHRQYRKRAGQRPNWRGYRHGYRSGYREHRYNRGYRGRHRHGYRPHKRRHYRGYRSHGPVYYAPGYGTSVSVWLDGVGFSYREHGW